MRIALITPLMEAVPPRAYGGTERVVATLASALTWAGHSVTVFATADSRVDGRLFACRDRPLLVDDRLTNATADQLTMLRRVRRRQASFDILHFHTETLHFPLFEHLAGKTVTTFHDRLDHVGLPEFFRAYRHFPVVSISDHQRRPLPFLNWRKTIPNGYPLDRYRPIPKGAAPEKDYLAFLGRIHPNKGIREAIEIARKAGRKLKIAARINRSDRGFWQEEIRPLVDGETIEYVGEIRDCEKSEFLSRASALLFPITWPEPFGLVMIEAMACGIPTIAFRQGSVPEVLKEGVTGAIVDDIDAAAAAAGALDRFDREAIRREFEERFSDATMSRSYLEVYEDVLRTSRVASPLGARLPAALRPQARAAGGADPATAASQSARGVPTGAAPPDP